MNKMFYLFLFVFILSAVTCFAQVDMIIPKGSSSWKSINDFKDGIFVSDLFTIGNSNISQPKTSLYLKYDAQNVYACFECFEDNKNYPIAFKRKKSNLMLDDSVMLVFGLSLSSSLATKMNMGGYEGAYSEILSADCYYQFITNAAGANQRTYNETPMERPLFESKVQKEKNKFCIFMKIPFASFGLNNLEKEVFFNAFRSRPPELFGFYNMPYGGYAPFPLTKIKFSKDNKGELLIDYPAKQEETKENIISDFSFRYYPVKDCVAGQVKAENLTENAYISIEGTNLESKKIPLQNNKYTNIVLPIGDNPTLPINAVCKVILNGKTFKEESLTIEKIPEKPDFYNTQAGLTGINSVPTPWIKPILENNTVILADKKIYFGDTGFFSQVKGEEEFLKSPIKLNIGINGKVPKTSLIFQKTEDKGTYILSTAKLKVGNYGTCDIRIKTDFDGFSTIKFKSDDITPEDIDKLYLDIPMVPHKDEFVHRVTSQTIEKLEGFGWSGEGNASLWLGTYNMGIGYEADMPVFLSKDKRKQIEIKQKKDVTLLRFNFVDEKGQIKDKGHIFRFYLTPTPTKKYTLDKTGLYHGMDLWFENWSDWQGYPDLGKIPQMKERNEKDVKEDKKLIIYFSQSLASDSPASLDYFTDLTAYPERGWYKRAYDPGKDVVCYVSCLRELYGDLLLQGIEKLVKETGVNSVYLDGPANPWECTNPTHSHCETNAKITWDDGDICPYEATRNFLKRLRNILSSTGKPFKIIAHTGGAIYPSTMSLCDGHYEGEQMARFKPGYKLPLSAFAIGYCGMPWGFRVDELPMKPVYSIEQMRALALLHDSCVGNGPYGETGEELEYEIYKDFQGEDTEYFPYWKEQENISYKGKSLMSYYVNKDSAMIIFGNLNYETDHIVLDVSKLFGENVSLYNPVLKEIIKDNLKEIKLDLKPWRYTAVRVDKGEKLNFEIETPKNFIKCEKYDIINSVGDFNCNKSCERDDYSIKVKGIKYDTAAEISFNHPLVGEFYGEVNVDIDNILNIVIGDSIFNLQDGVWSCSNISFWNEGIFLPGNFTEKTLNLKISLTDNDNLCLLCNDKIVCANVTVNNETGKFALRTWNDDTIKVTPLRLVSKSENLVENIHPIR